MVGRGVRETFKRDREDRGCLVELEIVVVRIVARVVFDRFMCATGPMTSRSLGDEAYGLRWIDKQFLSLSLYRVTTSHTQIWELQIIDMKRGDRLFYT